MSSLITVSIDVEKIERARLVKDKYLNITLSVDDNTNQYGQNVGAYHSQSKEEREAKEPRKYLGNGKVIWTDGSIVKAEYQEQKTATQVQEEGDDDLPF